jgi:hypothetical protein
VGLFGEASAGLNEFLSSRDYAEKNYYGADTGEEEVSEVDPVRISYLRIGAEPEQGEYRNRKAVEADHEC